MAEARSRGGVLEPERSFYLTVEVGDCEGDEGGRCHAVHTLQLFNRPAVLAAGGRCLGPLTDVTYMLH